MTNKPICVVTEADWIPEDAVERLRSIFEVQLGPFSSSELCEKMQLATGCFIGLDHIIDHRLMGKNLKFIASPTTGLNHINMEHAQAKGIDIISLKGETEFLEDISATAELCWGLILSLVRKIPTAANSVESGKWDRDQFCGRELKGASLGIIGYGRLGRKVAKFGKAFGMKILVSSYQLSDDKNVEFCSQTALLKQADIVTLHADSRPDNYQMIGAYELSLMKESSYFINTSRGDLVDEQALLNALSNKTIAGAALDVLEQEFNPAVNSQSLIDYAKKNSNLIITPHVGGVTKESQYNVTHFIIDKLFKLWREIN